MKKVLLTSTALVAFAGAAAAEVSMSGSAEMGIIGGAGIDAQFLHSVDVRFTLSGETDSGLTFGAIADLADAADGDDFTNTTDSDGDFYVYIQGNFGRVTMGDTDGALDWALTEAGNISNPGSINDAETAHVGYWGNYLDGSYDGQILRYDNTFGDFGVAVSLELDDTSGSNDRDNGYAIGLKYSTEIGGANLDLGIGYQSAQVDARSGATVFETDAFEADSRYNLKLVAASASPQTAIDLDAIAASAAVTLDNGFSAGLTYTQVRFDSDVEVSVIPAVVNDRLTHVGLGVGYTFDAISVHANYGVFTFDDVDVSGFGLAAGYDLGGGASVLFGYNTSNIEDLNADRDNVDLWSLGLSMDF